MIFLNLELALPFQGIRWNNIKNGITQKNRITYPVGFKRSPRKLRYLSEVFLFLRYHTDK